MMCVQYNEERTPSYNQVLRYWYSENPMGNAESFYHVIIAPVEVGLLRIVDHANAKNFPTSSLGVRL